MLLDLMTTTETREAIGLAGLKHKSKRGGCAVPAALVHSVGNRIPHARLGES